MLGGVSVALFLGIAALGWRGRYLTQWQADPAPVDLGEVFAGPRVSFIAIGDAGEATTHRAKVVAALSQVCAERTCDFGLLLGDNVYPRGYESADDDALERQFVEPFGGLGFPFYGVLGNHDYADSTQEQPALWELAWAKGRTDLVMPSPYYRFHAGPADFVALDTTRMFWFGGAAQADWLASLSLHGPRIAFGHHPYLSVGPHGSAGYYEGLPRLPFVSGNALKTFFETSVCGAYDLYISAHDHSLQVLEGCGMPLLVSGAGAKPTRIVDNGTKADFASAKAGFMWLSVDATSIHVVTYDETAAILDDRVLPISRGL